MASNLAWKAAAGLFVFIVSVLLYHREQALEHFVWHLAYAGSFGLLAGAAYARLGEVLARHPSLWFGGATSTWSCPT